MRNSITELASETQQEIEIMVKDVKGSVASNGAPYQRLSVQDKEGNMATFLRFDEPVDVNGPAVCRMLVEASTYNNKPSYKVLRSEVLPDADFTCFYPKRLMKGQVLRKSTPITSGSGTLATVSWWGTC